MKEVTIQQISKLIGLPEGTVNVHLARFGKYMRENKGQFFYKFNRAFVTDLRDFYKKKMLERKGMYAVKYFKVVFKLEQLLEKEKAVK